MFEHFAVLLGRSYYRDTRRPQMILMTCWAVVGLIIITHYTCRLSSELTVPDRPKQAITTRQQLIVSCIQNKFVIIIADAIASNTLRFVGANTGSIPCETESECS